MKVVRFSLVVCVILAVVSPVAADETLHRYEADGKTRPSDEPFGWQLFNPCEPPCTETVENGHLVFHWSQADDLVDYHYQFGIPETMPPPDSLWVEWRFRSNHPLGPIHFTCDALFVVSYGETFELVNMYGDAAISFSGDAFIVGLAIEEFHTYRYESIDGLGFTVAVDGKPFIVEPDDNAAAGFDSLKLGGLGGCIGDQIPNMINEWDFVRFGKISAGEQIIASDPPPGLFDTSRVSFKVTFDSASYVYIDDITVEVTGGTAPTIIATRRAEGDEPDTVEIVLDQPLPLGETTTFRFDTGLPVNCDETQGEIVNCIEIIAIKPIFGVCGNDFVDQKDEECDGTDAAACPGSCREDCTCAVCGDGIRDPVEECDRADDVLCPGACRIDCICRVCGDEFVDNSEECDDGTESATCDADCTVAKCGDGTLNITAGEECDDGPSNSDAVPNACRTNCVLPTCGDSVTDTGEDCDDGAETTTCDADCSLAECGDGTLNVTAGEGCDDGAANSDTSANACRTNCKAATCGDNVTDSGEECDGIDDSACEARLCQSDCTCPEPGIPTVSHWGLVAMGVLLLIFSKRYFGPRRLA